MVYILENTQGESADVIWGEYDKVEEKKEEEKYERKIEVKRVK